MSRFNNSRAKLRDAVMQRFGEIEEYSGQVTLEVNSTEYLINGIFRRMPVDWVVDGERWFGSGWQLVVGTADLPDVGCNLKGARVYINERWWHVVRWTPQTIGFTVLDLGHGNEY